MWPAADSVRDSSNGENRRRPRNGPHSATRTTGGKRFRPSDQRTRESWSSAWAPAAHGANRTGRMFTGDRSGDWLYRAIWQAGLANQPESASASDGLELLGTRITSIVHCAPPANKPTVQERDRCLPYFRRELELLAQLRVIVCLGSFAWENSARVLGIRPRPKFAHGLEHRSRRELRCSVRITPVSETRSPVS